MALFDISTLTFLPPVINISYQKTNVSVTSVEYGTKTDLYNRDMTGFFFKLQQNITSTPIDSVDQLDAEGVFAMEDILDISQTSRDYYIYDGTNQYGIIPFDTSQLIPDRTTNSIYLYSGAQDSLSINALPPYTTIQNTLDIINLSPGSFFLYSNSSVQTLYTPSLSLTNLSYDATITLTGTDSTNIQLDGTILELNGIPNTISSFTDIIATGFLELVIFFDQANITETTGASFQFSNTSTFQTISVEVPIDTIDSTIPFIVNVRDIVDTDIFQTYIRVNQAIDSSYELSMRYAIFYQIEPTGLPNLLCQNSTSNIIVNPTPPPPPPYIERLKQPTPMRNQKMAYVESIPYLRNLSNTLLDRLRNNKRNEVPSLNIANTFSKRVVST